MMHGRVSAEQQDFRTQEQEAVSIMMALDLAELKVKKLMKPVKDETVDEKPVEKSTETPVEMEI